MSEHITEPVIDTNTKQDEYIELLKLNFPSCLQQLEDGSYTLNVEQLQLMLEPKNCKLIEESFGLSWVGKKEAYHNAYIPNTKILKPLLNDSKNFADTGNILIKGDNLDVLKLLRKNYFEKIKMIYIDPPYNTQSDEFIYIDDYTKSQEEILDYLGYSPERKEYIKNIAGAKTHSGWLSFMYPRLLLARDLLKDDGVIFISIDDNEQANLKLLCEEVFGQDNILTIPCKMSEASGVKMAHVDNGVIPKIKEYILICNKSSSTKLKVQYIEKEKWDKAYNQIITNCSPENTNFICNVIENDNRTLEDIQYLDKLIKQFNIQPLTKYALENNITLTDQWKKENSFRIVQFAQYSGSIKLQKSESEITFGISPENKLYLFSKDRKLLFASDYLTTALGDMWWDIKTTGIAKEGGVIFKNGKKPLQLLKRCINMANTYPNDIILDFFAGSGTTGDAVMQLNAEDGGNRKFILVQIDDKIKQEKQSEAYNFVKNELGKVPTIFEITAERLRRAGKKILEECKDKYKSDDLLGEDKPNVPDVGFKVYEITSDKYNSVYDKSIDKLTQDDLDLQVDGEAQATDSITILTNLMLGSKITLDTPFDTILADTLYRVDDKLFILKEFELNDDLFKDIEYIIVYGRNITNDSFIANLTTLVDNDKNKIIIKG